MALVVASSAATAGKLKLFKMYGNLVIAEVLEDQWTKNSRIAWTLASILVPVEKKDTKHLPNLATIQGLQFMDLEQLLKKLHRCPSLSGRTQLSSIKKQCDGYCSFNF